MTGFSSAGSARGAIAWPAPGSGLPQAGRGYPQEDSQLPADIGPGPDSTRPESEIASSSQAVAVQPLLLDVQALVKRYANGVLANDAVSLQLRRGQVHAILGENGAGKSSLLKMLYGLEQPDAGQIVFDGQPRHFRGPADALQAGIGLVPQHLQLLRSMTVAENLALGQEPMRGLRLDHAQAAAAAQRAMQQYGLAVPVQARVGELPAGLQQRVALLKALHRGARLLLLDEPTALLTPAECDVLFASLRALAAQGLGVLLITHKMAEVEAVADRYTVLRAGKVTGSGSTQGLSPQALATMMMGHALPPLQARRVDARGRPARLSLQGLTVLRPQGRPALDRVCLQIAGGEILGIAGVEGNGQSELADVLAGLCKPTSGTLLLDDSQLPLGQARQMRSRGMGRIGEDRLHDGLAPGLSIADNLAVADYRRPPASRLGWLDARWLARRAAEVLQRDAVVARDPKSLMRDLSGGNMQKLVMAREIGAEPRCLVANQPTRGVDVGAAQRLHSALLGLRDRGAAVLLLSADIDELLALSDRIAVLFEGRLVAHFAADAVSTRTLGLYMTGAFGTQPIAARLDAPFTPGLPAADGGGR